MKLYKDIEEDSFAGQLIAFAVCTIIGAGAGFMLMIGLANS